MQRKSRSGSVVQDKRSKIWNFYWWEHGKRRVKSAWPIPYMQDGLWNAAQVLRGQFSEGRSRATPCANGGRPS